jgi:thioesterase domain-containing protein/aryl carrier-like protein
VVLRTGEAAAASDLRRFLADRVPAALVPAVVGILAALPVTPNGKVDRQALAAVDPLAGSATPALAPRDHFELELARVWENLLGVESVHVQDDFFARGGHSLLAVRLATRIEQVFGRSLPVVALFQAPTLEAMAGLLRRGADRPAAPSCLVPLAVRETGSPLFLIHAAAGHVFSYLDLARRLGAKRPVYGLQSAAWDGAATDAEIEAMAERYAREIATAQPQGRCHLAGWSFGGVVALATARRLAAAGREIGLLALLDSRLPCSARATDLAELDLLAAFARDLGLGEEDLAHAAAQAGQAELTDFLGQLLELARQRGALPADFELDELARLFALYRRNAEALLRHVPRTFSGSALLLVAAESRDSPLEAARCWQGLAGNLTIASVAGDHYSMLRRPHVEQLAAALAEALDDREREPS